MTSLDDFRQALSRYWGVAPTPRSNGRLNEDLRGGDNYPPCDAELIADSCAVIGLMRGTRGNVDQPTWYHSLSVIGACEDGTALAHAWSNGHPNYSPEETTAKLAQAMTFPPSTCSKLHDTQPALCEECPHYGKLGSPIRLGFANSKVAAPPSEEVAEQGTPRRPLGPLYPMPGRFTFTEKNGHCVMYLAVETKVKGEPPEWVNVPFCGTLHYPIKLIYASDGVKLEIEACLPRGGTRIFVLPGALIGQGGSALHSELGKNGIFSYQGQKMKEEGYLTQWMDKLRSDALAVNSYHRFGWYEHNFLLGKTLITPAGNVAALCHGNALRKVGAFQPKGDYETWKRVIDTAYNSEGQEALQFLVLLGFAAPLFSMLGELGGVTVHSHSQGSGVGKTTAQRAALSVWGDWQELQLADGKATMNALWGLVGTYCHLPVMFDELTNQSNEMASNIVFSVAQGRDRIRMGPDGELKDNNSNWSTILMASGNNLLTEKLALNRNNAEAEISRAFEFTVPNNSTIAPNQARDLFPKLGQHYGHAGLKYIEYVVQNREAVRDTLRKFQTKYNDDTNALKVERYWSGLHASVMTALYLTRQLGILNFAMKPLWAWIKEHTCDSRAQRTISIGGPVETFGVMLTELWQGILITKGEGDLRRGLIPQIIQDPNGRNLTGRKIFAADKSEKDVLYLSTAAVNKWCAKHGASGKELHAVLVHKAWVDTTMRQVSLGKGVPKYVGSNVKCWVMDPAKIEAESGDAPIAQRLKLLMQPGKPDEAHLRATGATADGPSGPAR